MADYKVVLVPSNETEILADLLFESVDIVINQMGWLTFTNDRREPVAIFNPAGIRYVVRCDGNVAELPELVDDLPDDVRLVN